MEGDQSHGTKPEERKEAEEHPEPEKPDRRAPEDSPGELPQCMMGNRKVDDMSFMISCTNWY